MIPAQRQQIIGIAILLSLLWIFPSLSAQTINQNVRGKVFSKASGAPLSDVQVQVLESDPVIQTTTDSEGNFLLEGITVGRHDIGFAHVSFQNFIMPGVMLVSSHETWLEIGMEETIYTTDEVVITPYKDRGLPNNDMALVSAISFSVEETRKFAGGLDDPVRLAANLPGVTSNGFLSDNMVSIRGNSPRGMLYRVEGADVPNPNHFARIGSSGGSFTIFSMQMLDNSDFFVSAFPAEYGNAMSGVFDINFRKGNNQTHQFALQAGVLGVDLAAEGPLNKETGSSYLVNYRYSSLGLANLLVSYAELPTYQDLAFNFNIPTKKSGTFSVFGMAGLSSRFKSAEQDSTLWTQDLDRFENVLRSDMAIGGLSHTVLLSENTTVKSTLVGSYNLQKDNKDYLIDDLMFIERDRNEYERQPITISSSVKHRFSARHSHKSGISITTTGHRYLARDFDFEKEELFTLVNETGRTATLQAYSQSKYRLGTQLTLNGGLHFMYFSLNNQAVLEPRLSLSYELKPGHYLTGGYGLHHQAENFATYMTRLNDADGGFSYPNRDLTFARAHHGVLGYKGKLTENHRIRVEAYYQNLSNVPVEPAGSYSVINLDQLDQLRILENNGTGLNYGLDMGFERFTDNGLYYMINASIYESLYTGDDGVQRSTQYDNNYNIRFLMGKEYKVGKKRGRNNLLGFNTTFSAIGGRPYTPIDLDASELAQETRLDESQYYSLREDGLYVLDFTTTLQINKPKHSSTWAIQIKNLFSSAVPAYREYDPFLQKEILLEGAVVLPVMSYKIEF